MATELLFVPWGWFEEFEPSDIFSPIKEKKITYKYKIRSLLSTWYFYKPINLFLAQDIYLLGNTKIIHKTPLFPHNFTQCLLCIFFQERIQNEKYAESPNFS